MSRRYAGTELQGKAIHTGAYWQWSVKAKLIATLAMLVFATFGMAPNAAAQDYCLGASVHNDAGTVTEGTDNEVRVFVKQYDGSSCNTSFSNHPVEFTLSYETISGTATAGDDFSVSTGSITVPAGGTPIATLDLPTTEDLTYDGGQESYTFRITGVVTGTGNAQNGFPQVTLNIDDADTAPTVTLSAVGSPIAETGGSSTLTATLSGLADEAVTAVLGFTGTAVKDTDYAVASSIVVPAGQLSANESLSSTSDTTDEFDETAIVDITSVTNGTESGTQQVIVTITDDDCPAGSTLFVDDSVTSSGLGSSWSDALKYIHDAVDIASDCAGITEIRVAGGTYYPDEGIGQTNNASGSHFPLLNNVAIRGGYSAANDADMTRDFAGAPSVLSGDLDQSGDASASDAYHVVRCFSPQCTTTTPVLDGFTVERGYANGGGGHYDGAGLHIEVGSPVLSNLLVRNNSGGGTGAGGGAWIGYGSRPRIYSSTFESNSNYDGGGMSVWDGDSDGTSATIVNVEFVNNAANGARDGGGIQVVSGAHADVANSLFRGNSAADGGGMFTMHSSTATVTNSTFYGNTGDNFANRGTSVIRNSILWAPATGADVNDGGSGMTVSNSVIQDGFGGATTGDPAFVNAASADFQLGPTSSAIDLGLRANLPGFDATGAPGTLTTDLAGNPRVVEYEVDAGAFESDHDYDFGDLPDPFVATAGKYPTLAANDGARHYVPATPVVFLGAIEPDAEVDGLQSANAAGDAGDEDGATFQAALYRSDTASQTNSVTITTTGAGKINAWIDWDSDGDFDDAGDQILTDVVSTGGTAVYSFTVPAGDVEAANTGARIRYSTAGGDGPTGRAVDGEVEDYLIALTDVATQAFAVPDPATTGIAGPFTISGAPGQLEMSAATGGLLFSTDSAGGVTVTGTDGDDSFVVDFTGGNPIPMGGLSIDGGDEATATGDVLTVTGTTFTDVVDGSTGVGAGVLTMDGSVVNYSGLEPVIIPAATNVTKDGTAGADVITIEWDGANVLISEATAKFESLAFPSATGTVTINGLDADDDLILDPSLDAAGAGKVGVLVLNGNDGDDDFQVPPPTNFSVDVNGGAHTDRDILDLDLSGVATGKEDISSTPPLDGQWTFAAPETEPTIDFTDVERHLDAIDLDVDISHVPPTAPLPTTVDVTITVNNLSTYAVLTAGAKVDIPIPTGLTFDSIVAGSGYDDGMGVWTLGSIAGGASQTLIIRLNCVGIDDVDVVATLDRLTARPIDYNSANDTATTTLDKPALDFGDAPIGYPVAFDAVDDGARHYQGQVGTLDIRLGVLKDTEANGVNSAAGMADTDGADEDGISFPPTIFAANGPSTSSITVTNTGTGVLNAWIDFDGDKSWADGGVEQIFTDVALAGPDTRVLGFSVPGGAAAAGTVVGARFRYCTAAGTCDTSTGAAPEGEVEDYVVLLDDTGVITVDLPTEGLTGDISWSVTAGTAALKDGAGTVLFSAPVAEVVEMTVTATTEDDVMFLDYTGGVDIIPSLGFIYNGGDGDDELRVDLAGTALPDGKRITFNGGDPTTGPGDVLRISDSVGGGTYRFLSDHTDEDSGTLTIDDAATGLTSDYNDLAILYDGLEPIFFTATPVEAEFRFNDDANQIVLNGSGDAGGAGDGNSFIDCITCGESVTFVTPTDSLVVRPGGGDDTITFPNLDVAGPVALNVRLEGDSGADRFVVTPSPFYDPHIDGEDPVLPLCYGDILDIVTEGGITDHSLIYTSIGSGRWTFTAGSNLDVTFVGIESQLDARTDISVDVTASGTEFYPTDPVTLGYKVTNTGFEHATCVTVDISIPAAVNPSAPIVPDRGLFYAENPPTLTLPTETPKQMWLIPWLQAGVTASLDVEGIMDAHIQDTYLASLAGMVPATAPEPRGLVISVDSINTNDADSVQISLLPTFPFPAKGHGVSALQVNLPNGLERVIVGLAQGSPGLNTGLLCRIPDPDGVLFTQVGVGNRWRPCGEGLPHPMYVTDLFLDSRGTAADSTDDRVWLSTWGSDGLYYSDDFGLTFTSAMAELPGENPGWSTVYAMEEDASGILYLSANTGTMFRSFDRGSSWQKVTALPGASADTPWSLTAHPSEPGVLYAGVFGRGVYHTADYGFNWQPLGGESVNNLLILEGAGHVFDLQFSPDSDEYLFAGTGQGVHRIRLEARGGIAGLWDELPLSVTLDNGMEVTPEVRTLAFDPDAEDVDDNLLVGSWGFGAFVHRGPLTAPTQAFEEFTLRSGEVSMLLPMSDGRILVGSRNGGIEMAESGAAGVSTEIETSDEIPTVFALDQNYPNPFNPVTTITFDLPESAAVQLVVFDILGREVAVLARGHMEAGRHRVRFDAGSLPSGTYIYRLATETRSFTRQLVLMK